MTDHNYVIFGSEADFYLVSYDEINDVDYAKYLYRPLYTKNKILNMLYRVHTSPRINGMIELPFKSLWNSLIYKNKFNNDRPICFVFFASSKKLLNHSFLTYLRKKYRDSKFVLFFQDLVRHSMGEKIDKLRDSFDLIISFDHEDAHKYGLNYYPLVFSKYNVPKDDSITESDVYFVGKAKDRLDEILAAYEKFRDAGLKCDFYITGVAPEQQKYADEIHYCGQMSYIENLKHVKATKALLEIMQQGGHGYTLRACEAIMYDKKMITNNPEVVNAPFYSPERISVFNNVDDINTEFVLDEPYCVDYCYKEQLSPLKLLEYIDAKLK